jgi:hypothetical protein
MAILIGVADADDHDIRPVPAALQSVRAMNRVLTDPRLCGWPTARVTVMRNPDSPTQTGRRLRDLTRAAQDILLLYYVGPALLSPSGALSLAIGPGAGATPEAKGLGYDAVARALRESPAQRKIVILDCCFTDRALGKLEVRDGIAGLTQVNGVYCLTAAVPSTATTAVRPATLQHRAQPTAFTGQLVELIESGLPGGPAELGLDELYLHLQKRLVAQGLPSPSQRGADAVQRCPFTRNAALERRSRGPSVTSPALATAALAPSGRAAAPSSPPFDLTPPPAPSASAAPPLPPRDAAPTALWARSPLPPAPPPPPPDAAASLWLVPPLVPACPPAPPDPAARPALGPPSLSAHPMSSADSPLGPPLLPPMASLAAALSPAAPFPPATTSVRSPRRGASPFVEPGVAVADEPAGRPEPASPAPPPPPPHPPGAAPPAPPAALAQAGAGSRTSEGKSETETESPAAAVGEVGPRRRRRRRIWLALVVVVAAVAVPVVYVTRPGGDASATGDRGNGGVDLRDLGRDTVSLGGNIRPVALTLDGSTLWVQSNDQLKGAELVKVDLDRGKIATTLPFPPTDGSSNSTTGDGSLWVTTSSIESMSGAVLRIDPATGRKLAEVPLPVWPGRIIYADDSIWVATVQQPVVEELGAGNDVFSSAANGITRIDPRTNKVTATIPLAAVPVDVRADDDRILVSTANADGAWVVVIDPATDRQVARIPVADAGSPVGVDDRADPEGPWMLFASDPYAVRVDVGRGKVAVTAGPRDGIDRVIPDGDRLWELRHHRLRIREHDGKLLGSIKVDGTPLAATAAGDGTAWIAYQPAGSSRVLVTKVPAEAVIATAHHRR